MPEDIFEKFAEDYDLWFEDHSSKYQAELARVKALVREPGTFSLEVGVGSGRFAAPLGIRLGIDPSRALCRMARRRGIEVLRARGEAIPFQNGAISSVLMVTVICFLEDPSRVLGELWRILAPGGIAVVAFIERGGKIHQKYLQEEGKGRFLSRATLYTNEEVQALLETAGFQVTATDPRAGFCVIAARKD